MSRPPTAAVRSREHRSDRTTVVDAERAQRLLDLLGDADCRAILAATGDEALSAAEICEACGLPSSTAYRKLDVLTDAGLLEERTRISQSGKHPSEYVCRVEDVVVSVAAEGGVELELSWCHPTDTDPFGTTRREVAPTD